MRKTRLTSLFKWVSLILLLHGCVEKEVLPKSTQSGKNTFGVKIDGKIWLPKAESNLIFGTDALIATYTRNSLTIKAARGYDEQIFLKILKIKSSGIFLLDSTKNNGIIETKYFGDKVGDECLIFPGGINEVNITKFDSVNKIVSGTFRLQLKSKNSHSIVNFSDGVFDVIYQ